MTGMTAVVVLQAALLGAGEKDYAAAYKEAIAQDKPLVVLVGADWCPGCVTMKHSVIPQVQRTGGLNGVAYAQVDSDAGVARRLMSGGSIPQLIIYTNTSRGWRRQLFVGAQSASSVENLIDTAISKQAKKPAVVQSETAAAVPTSSPQP